MIYLLFAMADPVVAGYLLSEGDLTLSQLVLHVASTVAAVAMFLGPAPAREESVG